MGSKNWQDIAAAKREAILASIPKEYIVSDLPTPEQQRDVTGTFVHQWLGAREIEITETEAPGIVAKTTTGEWSAVEVTKAFIHRASIAHQLTSCLHETAFPAALEAAAALDAHLAQTKTPLGPLHGLPVSLKDQFHVRGLDTSMGYVGWLGTFEGSPPPHANYPIATESALVTALRRLGAVVYVKTAVPHTLMCGETVNNIVGYVRSPRNRLLSAGGSSGGEGALIALKGSPCGFGTDIGGSVRIPAAFNGLCGLRPSAGRLPYEGAANSMDGQNSVLSVVGPLAGGVGGLRLLTCAVLGAAPWRDDPLVVEVPWRAEREDGVARRGRLTFGVLRDDGVVRVAPPVARALALAAERLAAAGHAVVEWAPPVPHAELLECCARTWTYDGGRDTLAALALSGEPQAEHVMMPFPEPLPGGEATATDIAANNVRQRRLRKAYLDYWNSTSVDAIIAPVAPFPAARPNMYKYYGYSMWVNLLDYTSVVLPVTKASKEVDLPVVDFEPRSELEKETQESYDPDIYDGAPVALQFVGRRLEEEKMLKVAEVVDGLLRG